MEGERFNFSSLPSKVREAVGDAGLYFAFSPVSGEGTKVAGRAGGSGAPLGASHPAERSTRGGGELRPVSLAGCRCSPPGGLQPFVTVVLDRGGK